MEVIASAVGVPHADLSSQFLDAEQKSTIKSLLKQGDILLETNNVYPLSQVITKILDEAIGSIQLSTWATIKSLMPVEEHA